MIITIKRTVLLAVLLVLGSALASPSFALDTWEDLRGKSRIVIRPSLGRNILNYTPTLTTGDTQSPTVNTSLCGGLTITVFGSTLTAEMQICNQVTVLGDAEPAVLECRDMPLTAVDGSASYGIQVLPVPGLMRLASITGSDSAQSFNIVCAP